MKDYLKLIRIKHWIKNFLVFLPILCGNVLNCHNIIITTYGFLSFCFASSFVYIINDIKDIEKDKLHPRKKSRPLASGKISKKSAIIVAIILIIISLIFNFLTNMKFFNPSLCLLLIYLIVNILYSFGLKNIAIVDIVFLTLGFILRVYYGSFITSTPVSEWLFLTIMSGALFLGLGKRKKEAIQNKEVRESLKDYTKEFLNNFQYTSLSLTLVFYSLWTIEKGTKYLIFTTALVLIIFMRYCLDIEKNDEGDPATIFYSDKTLLILSSIYALTMIYLLVFI